MAPSFARTISQRWAFRCWQGASSPYRTDERTIIPQEFDWTKPDAQEQRANAEMQVKGSPKYAIVNQRFAQYYFGDTAAAVLERAIEHLATLGLKAPEAVMSDNAFAYRRSNAFRAVLAEHGARHILTPPYTPRWNGKVERFIQTLKREWAYAHSWPNSAERARAMASFLRYYNRRRPHSSLGDRPPISRVHNVCG